MKLEDLSVNIQIQIIKPVVHQDALMRVDHVPVPPTINVSVISIISMMEEIVLSVMMMR